jgi:hypothetical protein
VNDVGDLLNSRMNRSQNHLEDLVKEKGKGKMSLP